MKSISWVCRNWRQSTMSITTSITGPTNRPRSTKKMTKTKPMKSRDPALRSGCRVSRCRNGCRKMCGNFMIEIPILYLQYFVYQPALLLPFKVIQSLILIIYALLLPKHKYNTGKYNNINMSRVMPSELA